MKFGNKTKFICHLAPPPTGSCWFNNGKFGSYLGTQVTEELQLDVADSGANRYRHQDNYLQDHFHKLAVGKSKGLKYGLTKHWWVEKAAD
jgi:hypothetical protein